MGMHVQGRWCPLVPETLRHRRERDTARQHLGHHDVPPIAKLEHVHTHRRRRLGHTRRRLTSASIYTQPTAAYTRMCYADMHGTG